MDMSNDLMMWSAIVAFAMPLIISVIQQPRWTRPTRALVAAITSGLAGLGTVYFTKPDQFLVDGSLTASVVLTVIIASMAAYRTFWEPLGVREIESATSPGDDTLELEAAIRAEHEAEHGIGVHVIEDEPPVTSPGAFDPPNHG